MAVVTPTTFQIAPGCKWRVVSDELIPKYYSLTVGTSVTKYIRIMRRIEVAVLVLPNCTVPTTPVNPLNLSPVGSYNHYSYLEGISFPDNTWKCDGGTISRGYSQVGPVEYREVWLSSGEASVYE